MKDYENKNLTADKRAKDLTSRLSPEEKCRQLSYDSPAIEEFGIEKYNWCNSASHGLEHSGTATCFPQTIALAATFSEEYVKLCAKTISSEARAKYNALSSHGDYGIYKGLTLWSPDINIYRDPRWGKGIDTFGEDPYLTGELGKAYVEGIQGDGEYMNAAACLKNFACSSGPENIIHGYNVKVSPKDLEETYLPHFRKIITETDIAGVMGAPNALNGEPCCASDYLQDLLRNEWGFNGYFVSDYNSIEDLHGNFMITDNEIDSAAYAINHGCDLCFGKTYENLLSAYYKGKVYEETINKSVERLMKVRFRLGIFDITPLDDLSYSFVDTPENRHLTFETALRSFVLLKNDGVLPIDENEINTIAVIGPMANEKSALLGSGNISVSSCKTYLEGIKGRFINKRVIYAKGCEIYNEKSEPLAENNDRLSEALAAAEISDIVILFLGNDPNFDDKEDLRFPKPQRELLKQVSSVGKPCILVTCSGYGMNPENNNLNAEIQGWYSGEEGADALAAILFGDYSPSGKLPLTFYKYADKLSPFDDYSMYGRTYRYASNENIRYHFGDGLCYSKIEIKIISWKAGKSGGSLMIEAGNFGNYDIEDVIEIYMYSNSPDAVQNVSLCGFQRVKIEQNQQKRFIIHIDTSAFTVVDDEGNRYIDASSEFVIYAGNSYPNKKTAFIKLNSDDFGKE